MGLRLAAVCISVAFAIAFAGSTRASDFGPLTDSERLGVAIWAGLLHSKLGPGGGGTTPAVVAKAPPTFATYGHATVVLDNYGTSLEPGEPTLGGKMAKTVWARFTAPEDARLVIDTFGSEIDTVLAVYTGTSIGALTLVASGDDHRVDGVWAKQSLVQLDVTKGTAYAVQVGGKGGAEGTVQISVAALPPGGGVSAHLLTTDGYSYPGPGHQWICRIGFWDAPSACPRPAFLVHNSRADTISVAAALQPAAGVTAPAKKTLAAGASGVQSFVFGPGYDTTTVRATSGRFTFTATAAGKTVSSVDVPALTLVRKTTGPVTTLKATVDRRIGAALVDQPTVFVVKLANTGTETATGCHVRPTTQNFFTIAQWSAWNEATAVFGAANQPFSLAAGASRTLAVAVASQVPRQADLDYAPPVEIACIDTDPAPIDYSNGFDLTAVLRPAPVVVVPGITRPTGGVLDVPAGGKAVTTVSVGVLYGSGTTLTAVPFYRSPSGEAANTRFAVGICPGTTSDADCKARSAASLNFTATPGAETTFKVVVTAPAVDPGYAPGKRRIGLELRQTPPLDVATAIGAADVAVRRK